MLRLPSVALVLAVALGHSHVAATSGDATPVYDWVSVEYDWPSAAARDAALGDGTFQPRNNIITGIKLDADDNVYVTVPRWRPGVPSTLNKVVTNADGKPVLQPFPSWAWNDASEPSALQYVQSMEVDTRNRMWILDVGRRNIFNFNPPQDVVNGPAKVVVYDLNTDTVVHNVTFADADVPFDSSFLNDLVVDDVNDVAYISDTGTVGAVVVLDVANNRARRWGGDPSQQANTSFAFSINNVSYPQIQTNMDPIALSPDVQTLYYSALDTNHVYSVPTALLRDWTTTADQLHAAVTFHGAKPSASDGMTFGANGRLYFGAFRLNGVMEWDVTQPLSSAKLLCSDDVTMQWQDTFAWDSAGNLWFTTNRLQLFFTYHMDFTGATGSNMHVFKVNVDSASYLSAEAAAGAAVGRGLAVAAGVPCVTATSSLSQVVHVQFTSPATTFTSPCNGKAVTIDGDTVAVDSTLNTSRVVPPSSVASSPAVSWSVVNGSRWYHMFMVQVGANTSSSFVLQATLNMPGGAAGVGQSLFSYLQPAPYTSAAGADVALLLFETETMVTVPSADVARIAAQPYASRVGFDLPSWVAGDGHQLGAPVGVVTFRVGVSEWTAAVYSVWQNATWLPAATREALQRANAVGQACKIAAAQ